MAFQPNSIQQKGEPKDNRNFADKISFLLKQKDMLVEQLYTNCLSEAAYFIADNGEAAIIDPIRDIEQYLSLAKKHQARIKYIFETHFHADFLSGHLELAEKTGAQIIYGPTTHAKFKFHEAKNGEQFSIGNLKIELLHTPGHTLESSCYLLFAEDGQPYCVFSGDTLFVGDVGRPDLFSGELSKEELAGMMFESLKKLKALPDNVIVYPAHGPGSACGKALGKETYSTIGTQKATNYALKAGTQKDFIQQVTDGLKEAPAYFAEMARLNSQEVVSLESVLEKSLKALSPVEVEEASKGNVWLLDVRNPEVFTQEFVPGSVNIGLNGRFAEWAGKLLPYTEPIIVIADEDKEKEAIIRLARVGFQNVIGYLKHGILAWKAEGKATDMIIDVAAEELAMDIRFDKKIEVIDVRNPGEFEAGHVKGAQLTPLESFNDPMIIAQIDEDKNLYVHCAGGYRSATACSLMKRQGFTNLRNVLGGWNKIKAEQDMPLVFPHKQTV